MLVHGIITVSLINQLFYSFLFVLERLFHAVRAQFEWVDLEGGGKINGITRASVIEREEIINNKMFINTLIPGFSYTNHKGKTISINFGVLL